MAEQPLLTTSAGPPRGLAALRRFAGQRAPEERCELCSAPIHPEHAHLMEVGSRQLICACDACAILFEGQNTRYRRVPRDVQLLSGFRMTDELWNHLHIPISLAYFVNSAPAGRAVAYYPSPGGPTEAELPAEAWDELAKANPLLHAMQLDVEALLANRVRQTREYYLAPIDACYKLVGVIRCHWRGLSGGTEVWKHIEQFFTELKERASHRPGA